MTTRPADSIEVKMSNREINGYLESKGAGPMTHRGHTTVWEVDGQAVLTFVYTDHVRRTYVPEGERNHPLVKFTRLQGE